MNGKQIKLKFLLCHVNTACIYNFNMHTTFTYTITLHIELQIIYT